MDEDSGSLPKGPARRSATEIRREREAEALRANLRRRKDQRRARETAPDDAAGTPAEKDPDDSGLPR